MLKTVSINALAQSGAFGNLTIVDSSNTTINNVTSITITPSKSKGSGSNVTIQLGIYEAVAGNGTPKFAQFSGWVNQGDANASDGNATLIITAPGNSNVNLRVLQMAVPTAPYSVYLRASPVATANIFTKLGLILRNSTSGRMLFNGMQSTQTVNSVSTLSLTRFWSRWSDPSGNTVTTLDSAAQWQIAKWLRIDVTSTTATPWNSENGWDWAVAGPPETLSTYINAANGTVDQMGIGVDCRNANGTYFISCFQTVPPA